MTVKEIMNMQYAEFNRMTEKELRAVVLVLADAGNKRLKDFETEGISSPAYVYIKDHGGKFSTKGKNLQELKHEFTRAINFMGSATGTVRGARKLYIQVSTKLAEKGVKITPEQYDKFWKSYEKLKDKDPRITERQYKYGVLTAISNVIQKKPDITVRGIQRKIGQELESIRRKEIQNNGTERDSAGVSKYYRKIK